MTFSKTIGVAFSVVLATAGVAGTTPLVEAANAPGVVCAGADAMMAPHAAPKMARATGNIDKDFAGAMLAQDRAMMAMAKIEVECGKNPKAKAAARAFLDEAQQHMETMNLILHTN